MNKLKLSILTIFCLFFLFTLKAYSCQSLGDFLKLPHHPQHGINVSLTQMVSLEYVRHAFSKNYNTQSHVCTEVLVLSKNEYQYYRYFIKITVNDPTSNQGVFYHYVYFQDASTQAFHNYFSKPWIGLAGIEIQSYLSHLKNDLDFRVENSSKNKKQGYHQFSVTTKDALLNEIKKTTLYKAQERLINHQTLSIFSISNNSFLITWMKKLSDSGNPYIDSELSEGFYVTYNSIEKVYEAIPFRPAFFSIPLSNGQSLTLYEALEGNLLEAQKTSGFPTRDFHLFNLRTSL